MKKVQLIIARTIWQQPFSKRTDCWDENFNEISAPLVDPGPLRQYFYTAAIETVISTLVVGCSRSTNSGAMSTFVAIAWR